MMNTRTVLDSAVFQLSPRRSRCELFASGDGKTEKLASGLLKPFASHLKAVEEQISHSASAVRLNIKANKNNATWFNKGTLERFVRFISTPEVLEMLSTLDAEMSQLEGARKLYTQGEGVQLWSTFGDPECAVGAPSDVTKNELLRAIDMRLAAVKQDLVMACARASAAGFTIENISELLLFADYFGANHLKEACTKFSSLCLRRPELISSQHQDHMLLQTPLSQWKDFDENLRSSSSDMSIDEPEPVPTFPSRQCENFDPWSSDRPSTTKTTEHTAFNMPAMNQQLMSTTDIVEKMLSKSPVSTMSQDSLHIEPGESNRENAQRRLSLKDRINFFESKQKEQNASTSIISGSGSNANSKAVGHKVELRRLPSDSNLEKSVLRRWSGASDMSIDLGNSDNRVENENAAGKSSSSSGFLVQSESDKRDAYEWRDNAPPEVSKDNKSTPSSLSLSLSEATDFLIHKGEGKVGAPREIIMNQDKDVQGSLQNSITSCMELQDKAINPAASIVQSRLTVHIGNDVGSTYTADPYSQYMGVSREQVEMKIQGAFQILPKNPSTSGGQIMTRNQRSSGSQQQSWSSGGFTVDLNSNLTSSTEFKLLSSKRDTVCVKPKGRSDVEHQLKCSSVQFEVGAGKIELPFSNAQRTYPQKSDKTEKKEETLPLNGAKREKEHSDNHGNNSQRKTSPPDHCKDLWSKKFHSKSSDGVSESVSMGRKSHEHRKTGDAPSPSIEQAGLLTSLKGSIQLNDELQVKADELDKLFAVHKLRVLSDQMASSQRNKTPEVQADDTSKVMDKMLMEIVPVKESICNELEFDSTLTLKMVDSQEYVHSMNKFNSYDENRGKFYLKYMEKRDAKLIEESGFKRAQKEAKMKAMLDSLACSQVEMKAKLAESAVKLNSINSCERIEDLRCNSSHSIKIKDRTMKSQKEGKGDAQELSEQVDYCEDKLYCDMQYIDGSSRSSKSNNLLYNKRLASSTPQTSVSSAPRNLANINSSSAKCKMHSEISLAQSVPNFINLRKENTKPSSGAGKLTNSAKLKNFSRSRSTATEATLIEDKSRSQSLRINSTEPGEFKNISPLTSGSTNLASLLFAGKRHDHATFDINQKNGAKKYFLKGNGSGLSPGKDILKLKPSTSDIPKDETEGLLHEQENSHNVDKDNDSWRETAARNPRSTDNGPHIDKQISNQLSKSSDVGSENGDPLKPRIQATDNITYPSNIDTALDNMHGLLEEAPGHWNPHRHHSYFYVHEASDADLSVDSPSESPISRSSSFLSQIIDADAVRIRKKWVSAQVPAVITNSSHETHKVAKGFKRLLKFGRKNRGSENLVSDCVSASTPSECDDDTEEGCDIATCALDDIKNSKIGYPHPIYDIFHEGERSSEQVKSMRSSIPMPPANFKMREENLSGSSLKAPRSFFSLTSFKSKGTDSKLG